MMTYAGGALAEHVVKPAIDTFNKIAGDRMQIELSAINDTIQSRYFQQ